MIDLHNVYKAFGTHQVLRGISFQVGRGETFVIIGLSGIGKTVTLKLISGLQDPDAGEVYIEGTLMSGASRRVRDTLRKKMGVVFQSGALINWMSVWDNVALPLVELRQHPLEEIRRRVDEKLDLLQLWDARETMPSDLSGGMRKRVCLARVLVREPEIILYDEPTSGLDPVMTSVINNLIKQTRRDFGVASVVVTHDMPSAYDIADRIAVLYDGKIIQNDTPEGIRTSRDPVVQQFIRGEVAGPIDVHSVRRG